jgi:ketosteroid isomerase-like protein
LVKVFYRNLITKEDIMKQIVFLFSILMLVISGCAKKIDLEVERAVLRNADAEWSKVTGAKNLEGFMGLVSENGSIFPPNEQKLSESAAIRKWISDMMANPGFAVNWQPLTVEVSTSGDLGYTMGTYNLTLHDPQGKAITDSGKYVTVWKKQPEGKWKVVADIFNSNLPLTMATEQNQ